MSDKAFLATIIAFVSAIILITAIFIAITLHIEAEAAELCESFGGSLLHVRGTSDLCALPDGTVVDLETYRAK